MPPEAEAPQAESCWFCRSAPPEKDCAAEASLYSEVRLTDVQTTAVGYNVAKSWKTLKVPVPRCRRCAGAHAARRKLIDGFTVVPVLAVVVAALCAYRQLDGLVGVMVVSVVGGLLAAGLGRGLGYLLGRMVTPSEVPDEKKGREHPAVKALLAQGWKLGAKPQPGEEFK